MKRSGLSMAAMVATVVMVLTVSTYAITARTVNPVVGLVPSRFMRKIVCRLRLSEVSRQ